MGSTVATMEDLTAGYIERKLYFLIPISLISTLDRVLTIMEEENKIMSASSTSKGTRLPYDGLFGDSNLIRLLRQVIADPFTEYRPIDLEKLTKNSPPTVRDSLGVLTSLGLLIKDESDHQHPVYRVNTESKRYIALTFLSYAILDDRNGTDCMDEVVADYYSEIRAKYEPCVVGSTYEYVQPVIGDEITHHLAIRNGHLEESYWISVPAQDLLQGEVYAVPISPADTVKADFSGNQELEAITASA